MCPNIVLFQVWFWEEVQERSSYSTANLSWLRISWGCCASSPGLCKDGGGGSLTQGPHFQVSPITDWGRGCADRVHRRFQKVKTVHTPDRRIEHPPSPFFSLEAVHLLVALSANLIWGQSRYSGNTFSGHSSCSPYNATYNPMFSQPVFSMLFPH